MSNDATNTMNSYTAGNQTIQNNVDQEAMAHYRDVARTMTSIESDILQDEPFNSGRNFQIKSIWLAFKTSLPILLVALAYMIVGFHLIGTIRLIANTIIHLRFNDIGANGLLFSFFMFLPVLIWVVSTNLDTFHFRRMKWATFYFAIANFMVLIAGYLTVILYKTFIPSLGRIELSTTVTAEMITSMAQIVIGLPLIVLVLLFYKFLSIFIKDTHVIEYINTFRLKHYMTFGGSSYDYDLKVVKDIDRGKFITVSEKDRYLHQDIVGATGTGKTSSVIKVGIYNDLEKRYKIEQKLKSTMVRWLKKGYVKKVAPVDDERFSLSYFEPVITDRKFFQRDNVKRFEKLKKKYRLAGATIISPESGLTDDICDMAAKFGFRVNRVDPKVDDLTGKLKAGFIGINPLYISPNLPEAHRRRAIIKKAMLVTDTIQKLNESAGGKADPYFTSINRIATTTLCVALMVCYPRIHPGKTPTLTDLLMLLSDKSLLQPYASRLEALKHNYKEYEIFAKILQTDFTNDRFMEHATGLRVQFANLVADPMIQSLVCSQESIDLDNALANGEITVVNIELGELGPINSSAVGQFFSTTFIDAVLRRPGNENTRSPHFWWIDEFPLIVTPQFEASFTLFRKYRVGNVVALQTYDQMQKTDFLKYLKGIMLNSCSTHMVFGRANIDDMETYSAISGQKFSYIEQKRTNDASIFEDGARVSTSDTITEEKSVLFEPYEVRNKDFQEVTFITVKDGRQLPAFHGKVAFLTKKASLQRKLKKVDWTKYGSEVRTKAIKKAVETPAVVLNNNAPIGTLQDEELTGSVNHYSDEPLGDTRRGRMRDREHSALRNTVNHSSEVKAPGVQEKDNRIIEEPVPSPQEATVDSGTDNESMVLDIEYNYSDIFTDNNETQKL